MPSSKKGNKKNNNDNDDDLKQEGNVKIQAVLLADAIFGSKVTQREDYQSFGLRPWSSETSTSSQILCPINNVPLVDYNLEFLASNGVEQVILVTGSESGDALEDYLTNSKCTHHNNLEFLFLKDTSLTNAGDALRELYKRNWIRESKHALPFLLVSGDVVADLDLREAMKAHKQRQSHDSAAVMTVIFKPILPSRDNNNSNNNKNNNSNNNNSNSKQQQQPQPSIVPRVSDLVVGLVGASSKTVATADAQGSEPDSSIDDSKDYRILFYDNNHNTQKATIPCSFLQQSQTQSTCLDSCGGLQVRHDLLDTGIAICSPDVLGRLEDEFDYLDLAHDFVANSVSEEEDGLQTRIYAHILEDDTNNNNVSRSYASRAVDFQTYHAISKDLLQRWAYPTVADRLLLKTSDGTNKNQQRRYKLVRVADHHSRNHRSSNNQRKQRPFRSLENTTNTQENETETETETKNKNKNDPFAEIQKSYNNNQYQYKEVLNPTKVGRTSLVVGPGMMGSHGTVGEGCLVARCVLGDSVVVGENSKLVDCHLMDNVTVDPNVVLDSCLVATNARICEGATLGKGCYVGEGCVIGKNVTVSPFTRITLAKDDDEDDDWGDDSDDDDDDDTNELPSSGDVVPALVGPDGRGKLWNPTLDNDDSSDDDDDSDDDDEVDNITSKNTLGALLQLQSIGGDPTDFWKSEERKLKAAEEELEDDGFSDYDDENGLDDTMAFSEFTGGTVTFGDDDDDGANLNYTTDTIFSSSAVIGRQKGIDVIKEMTEICMEFDDDCHPIENLAIELNSFKFSQNATYSDCAQACLLSILHKMEVSPSMTDGRLVSLLKTKLDKFWTGMLQKLCRGISEEVAIIEALEHAATIDQNDAEDNNHNTEGLSQKSKEIAQKLRSGMAFRFFLQTLHDQEVLSEEAILKWAGERRDAAGDDDDDPKQALFAMKSVQDFLEWLEEDDSDDDDSDDDDSD